VLAQWAVQTALGVTRAFVTWSRPAGGCTTRAPRSSRRCTAAAFSRSLLPGGRCTPSWAWTGARCRISTTSKFTLDLLEQKHVLVAPGVSFNVPYCNHFRITNLPDAATLRDVFGRIDELLSAYAAGPREQSARG